MTTNLIIFYMTLGSMSAILIIVGAYRTGVTRGWVCPNCKRGSDSIEMLDERIRREMITTQPTRHRMISPFMNPPIQIWKQWKERKYISTEITYHCKNCNERWTSTLKTLVDEHTHRDELPPDHFMGL